MSLEEMKVARIEDIPPSEQFIGVDSLFGEDPSARAAYSGAPGFTDGADAAHPITSAEASILARPEIAEALEEVYLNSNGNRPAAEADMAPVDSSLALSGLVWLKKNLGVESEVRREVIETRNSVLHRQQQEEQALQSAEAREAAAAEAREQARDAEEKARRKQEAEQKIQAAHDAERTRQMEVVIQHVKEIHPELDIETVSQLAGQLSSSFQVDGDVRIKPEKRFYAAVDKLTATFLDDPQRMVNVMGAVIVSQEFLIHSNETKSFSIAGRLVEKVGIALADAVDGARYPDLDEATIGQWLDVLGSKISPEAIPDEDQRNKEMARENNKRSAEMVGRFGKSAELAVRVLANSGVLPRTLIDVAHKNPEKYIKLMYEIGQQGLDPAKDPLFTLAGDIMKRTLENRLTRCLLYGFASPAGNDRPDLQGQAVDIALSLQAVGVPAEDIFHLDDMDKISGREHEIFRKALIRMGSHKLQLPETYDVEKHFKDFTDKILANVKSSNTLYGRLVRHQQSKPPIGFLKKWARRSRD